MSPKITLVSPRGPRPPVSRERHRGGYVVASIFAFAAASGGIYLLTEESTKPVSSHIPPVTGATT
ncbi:MAG TPA: hypothetical protein VMV23_05430 [Candidatus Nanopelagicaceae bacterium]|nr:hypothetical protein [Candidatus Nanopelagicaceae bacterium]